MVAHEKPYHDLTESSFLEAISRGVHPTVRDAWPPALRALLTACWRGDPAERPEFRELLPQIDQAISEAEAAEAEAAARPDSCTCSLQ